MAAEMSQWAHIFLVTRLVKGLNVEPRIEYNLVAPANNIIYDMVAMSSPPERIWVCSICGNRFLKKWLLKRHLIHVHGVATERAQNQAEKSEYWLAHRVFPTDFI
jgi:hypothetical protein